MNMLHFQKNKQERTSFFLSSRKLIILCSFLFCTALIISVSLFTKTFIRQTSPTTASVNEIVANKSTNTTSSIDISQWYGAFSGNGTSSLLTIAKNDNNSFKFSISLTQGEHTDSLTGIAQYLSDTQAEYLSSDGVILYFTLCNDIVSISKDSFCRDQQLISFGGDYIAIDRTSNCDTNHFFHKIHSFSSDYTYHLDLNKDGRADYISYKNGVLTINSESYNFLSQSANLDTSTFHMVDVDTRDDYINILIMDDGPSCDPVTSIITYTKSGEIISAPLGCNIAQLSFNNSGIISGPFRLDLLQTWYGMGKWQYKDNRISFLQEDFYKPVELITVSSLAPCSTQNIELYTEPNLLSTKTVLKPQEVEFTKTDNIHWVELHGKKDNTTGWIYLTNFNELPDEGLTVEQIFDHLNLYD